jgi:hypothetical protein
MQDIGTRHAMARREAGRTDQLRGAFHHRHVQGAGIGIVCMQGDLYIANVNDWTFSLGQTIICT